MTRLPIPGQDDSTWGGILNDFLAVAHNADGTLSNTGALAAKANDSAVVHNTGAETVAGTKTYGSSPVVPTPTLASQAANKSYVDSVASSGAPNATTSSTGLVQLAGDLGGTGTAAAAPIISDGAITNAKVSGAAAIAKSKLAALNIVDADISSISNTKITGLGGAAILNVGAAAGTVAAGDDSRIAGAVQKSTLTAKGDIFAATGTSTPARLGVGSDRRALFCRRVRRNG